MKQAMTPEEIKERKPYLDWSLSEKEYDYISQKLLHHLPNYTEVGLFSAMWSEHCSYKKSKPVLRLFPTKGERVIQGPGEGAGVVDIDDGQAVVFKAESHNHPTTVEPYQGAATGVGGILRDVFSMGARPVAILDSEHFGEIKADPVMRYKLAETVKGVGDYGNCMGIPNLGGETFFDACYQGNILLNAMCVGLMETKDLEQGNASGVGNSVMYVGADTGRDGIHGATFASADFSKEHETQRSAVQVGDPFMEKLLLEACLELIQNHREWIVGIQDMGAAGLVSSTAEMATEGGAGMELNLDLVPQREGGMSAYEIMLSESQERMVICVKAGHEADVKEIFDRYQLHCAVIGKIIDQPRYILHHDGQVVCDLPVTSLTSDVLEQPGEEKKPARLTQPAAKWEPVVKDAGAILRQLLAQPTLADKTYITRQYDSQVRTNTLVKPGSDSGVLRVRGSHKAIAMCADTASRYVYLDPEIGGQRSVVEAAANIVASGAEPLAITDCLNYGDPNDPEIYWELHHSVMGIAKACEVLATPVVSGNVSLYNENDGQAIYPSPMIGMVGLIKNYDHTIPMKPQNLGDYVYLVGDLTDNFAGSELQKLLTGKISGALDQLDLAKLHGTMEQLLKAEQTGLVASCHDLSEGGLATAASEMLFGTGFGLKLQVPGPISQLFSEPAGSFLVTVAKEKAASFTKQVPQAQLLGEVTNSHRLEITTDDQVLNQNMNDLEKIWKEAIPCLMKSKA